MPQNTGQVTLTLSNGWQARYLSLGEIRMGTYSWGVDFVGPDGQEIRYFRNHAVVAGPTAEPHAIDNVRLLQNGRYGHLVTDLDFEWVIDFELLKIAPYRARIYHSCGDVHLSHFEQPSFKKAQSYVRDGATLLYITFPFLEEGELATEWSNYVAMRKAQLETSYFDS